MMKKLLYIFCCLLLLITSCKKDFVNLDPTSLIAGNQAYSTPNAVQALMASLYSRIGSNFEDQTYGDPGQNDAPNYTWVWTDEATGSYSWSATGYQNTVTNGYGWWDYRLINDLNDFIVKIPSAAINEDLRTRYLAEARFLRAFIYFGMVKRYGGVPLVTKVLDVNTDNLNVPRSTEQEVYDYVGAELDAVINDLKPAYGDGSDKFRVTKYAAYALKCRAMLYAASEAKYGTVQINGLVGISASQANTYWQKAYDAANEIIKSDMFALYKGNADPAKNYQQLFNGADPNTNKEVLFAKAYVVPTNAYNFDFKNSPQSFKVDWGCFTNPTVEMVESYEYVDGTPGKLKVNDANGNPIQYQNPADLFAGKDPRFFASILYPNAEWHANGDPQGAFLGLRRGIVDGNQTIINEDLGQVYGTGPNTISFMGKDGPSTNGDFTKTGFYIKKYLTESSSFAPAAYKTATPGIVFRYGEVLLNFAEAAMELNRSDDALKAINQIRDRAGIKLLDASAVTIDKIRHERMVELAFEHHRYWDLRRWHTADKVLNNTALHALFPFLVWKANTNPKDMPYIFQIVQIPNRPTRTFIPATYYFPIGTGGADSYLKQNPGY
jgi:hypothetical protein